MSKKVLLLCLHRPDRSPSQRYRIEQYLPYLEANGFSFTYSYLLSEQDDKDYYSAGHLSSKVWIIAKSIGKRLFEMGGIRNYDLIYVQREAFMLGTAFFERFYATKVPMIFDFDDAIWLPNVSAANQRFSFLKDPAKTAKLISASNLVFAGNSYLAAYANQFNKNVVVVPTTINLAIYKGVKQPKDGRICIGWSGSFSTIEHFKTALSSLVRIKSKYGDGVTFKIIGDPSYYCSELDVQGIPWNSKTEVEDLMEFDIGIMPLPDNEWTKGKCGAKGLQYMGLGIPALMSPVGVNTEIIQNGVNGYLPASEDQWVEYLSLLIEQKELRIKIGSAGKETVTKQYSTEAWKDRYLLYFNQTSEGNERNHSGRR